MPNENEEQLNLLNEVLEESEQESAEPAKDESEGEEIGNAADEGDEPSEEIDADEGNDEAAAPKAKAELTEAEKEERHLRRSESVVQSWADPATKAARTSRASSHVEWTDAEGNAQVADYDSVAKAFIALGLPLSVHIGFRTQMRKEGVNKIKQGEIEYTFTAVEKGKVGRSAEEKKAEHDKKVADRLARKQAKIDAAAAKKAAGLGVPGGKRGRPAKAKPVEAADDQAGSEGVTEE